MGVHRPIEETELYRLCCDLADDVYALASAWPSFGRSVLGEQIARSADSIGANLVEGDGRGSDRDAVKFFIYARASARETRHWLERAKQRKLITEQTGLDLLARIISIAKQINGLINYRRNGATQVREERTAYPGNSTEDPFTVVREEHE